MSIHIGQTIKTKKSGSPYMISPTTARTITFWTEVLLKRSYQCSYIDFFLQLGLGVRYPRANDIIYPTTMGSIINLYRERRTAIDNIVAIESDEDVIDEWKDSGIKIFKGNWEDKNLVKDVKDYFVGKMPKKGISKNVIINGDNYNGINAGLKLYKYYLDLFMPTGFYAHFYTRGINGLRRINEEMSRWNNYQTVKWGAAHNLSEECGNFINIESVVNSVLLVKNTRRKLRRMILGEKRK